LAKYSQSPVINALSDKYHPLQALADVMTIQQTFPEFPRHNGRNLSVAWYITQSQSQFRSRSRRTAFPSCFLSMVIAAAVVFSTFWSV
jgi:ornithine carbamoyltransferase